MDRPTATSATDADGKAAPARVICLGGVFWESIFRVDHFPARGIKLLPEGGRQLASGMAPAAAVAMTRLGVPAALWARVGDDVAGHSVRADLAREGLDVAQVCTRAGVATAFSSILVDPAGERLVVPCFDPRLAEGADGLPLDAVRQAPAVLVDMRWPDAGQVLLERARAEGVPSVLDADLAPVDALWRLMPLADHVLLSEVALERLMPAESPDRALAALAGELPRAEVVGVTLGAGGALLAEPARGGAGVRAIPGFRVEPVDTLNAGDVWHGAYVAGLVEGLDLAARVRRAHAAAALKCTRPWGRLGAPDRAQVQAFLAAQDRVPA